MGYNFFFKMVPKRKSDDPIKDRQAKKAKPTYSRNNAYNLSGKMLVSPFPAKHMAKLRYFTNQTLDPAVAATGYFNFRANDLYDPDVTGAGHQPRGFDQWMTMYNKFTVLSSKIVVRFSSDVAASVICGVKCNTSATTSTDITEYCEDRMVSWTVADDTAPAVVSLTYNARDWQAAPPLSDDQQYGTASGSPANAVYFTAFVGPLNAGENISASFATQIEYTVMFHDPIQPTIS